jgi:hypothetical protein
MLVLAGFHLVRDVRCILLRWLDDELVARENLNFADSGEGGD